MHLPRIVIDTCVIVSALRSRRGASFQILEAIDSERFAYGVSVPVYLEYESRCLRLCESGETALTREQVSAILDALAFYACQVPVYFRIRPNLRDEDDNMIFECAANFGADSIVTHNVRDFRNADLSAYDIDIITPQEFVADRGVFQHG